MRPMGFFDRLSRLFRADDDGNSLPNTGGHAGSGTTDGQGSEGGSKDQVRCQLSWIIETATDDQEVSPVFAARLKPGEHGPIKEPLAFGSQALAELLPVSAPMQGGCNVARHAERWASGK